MQLSDVKSFFGLSNPEHMYEDYREEDHADYHGDYVAGERERRAEHRSYDSRGEAEVSRNYYTAGAAARRVDVDAVPTITPVVIDNFKQAARIADLYRAGDVVVFDLRDMDKDNARRVVDFAAGVSYSTGELRRVVKRVFALVPEGVDVPASELERAITR